MSYLPLKHEARTNQIAHAVNNLKYCSVDFDAIVCTGLSGALVAPSVAAALDIPLFIVRKGESSHGSVVENNYCDFPSKYVIIDDLIESGRTITRIKKQMSRSFPESQCVGIYMYKQGEGEYRFTKYKKRFPKMWMFGTNAESPVE